MGGVVGHVARHPTPRVYRSHGRTLWSVAVSVFASPNPVPPAVVGRKQAAGGEAAAALDQFRDNRFSSYQHLDPSTWPQTVVRIAPARSGGSFDPLGGRCEDVHRAQDVAAVGDHLAGSACGRWMFITLTVDRSLFLSPEHAYQRCNDRVRKVLGRLGALWACGFEVQTKTGDGWPHWHAIVFVPHQVSEAEARRRVRAAWSIREVFAESIDPETGEVVQHVRRVPLAGSRGICVEDAKDAGGVARYVAKYIVKPWDAVPAWMGDSYTRFRKARFSGAFYDTLERLHRHHRDRRPRQAHRSLAKSTRRTVFERMARSGCACDVFQSDGARWRYLKTVGIPIQLLAQHASTLGAVPHQLGKWSQVRFIASEKFIDAAQSWVHNNRADVQSFRLARLREVRRAWFFNRAMREAEDMTDGVRCASGARRSVRDDRGREVWSVRVCREAGQDDAQRLHHVSHA